MIGAETSRGNAQRVAHNVELALIVLTGASIAALGVIWVQPEMLLSSAESPALMRARLMRGIFSLAVPLVMLLFLSNFRVRITALLRRQDATPRTVQYAKYMWFLVIALIVIVLTMDAFLVMASLRDLEFN